MHRRRYRTEIVIPPDRFISLQLPPHLPEGRATVTVWVEGAADDGHQAEVDPDRQDIEWFEEFDGEDDDPSPPPHGRGPA